MAPPCGLPAAPHPVQARQAPCLPSSAPTVNRPPVCCSWLESVCTTCQSLQVVLGSLAIVAGLCVGGTSLSAAKGWSVAGAYEALRLLLVGAVLALHRRENIAKP